MSAGDDPLPLPRHTSVTIFIDRSHALSSSHPRVLLGQGGDNNFVRSNRGSVGDGLNLAIGAGAGTSRGMNTYYGHLMASPLRADEVEPKDYLPLAQYRE